MIIDLASRIVAADSTYSQPDNEGEIRYHDGTKSTDVPVLYRLPDDWLLLIPSKPIDGHVTVAARSVCRPPRRHAMFSTASVASFHYRGIAEIELPASAAILATNDNPLSQVLMAIHSRWS